MDASDSFRTLHFGNLRGNKIINDIIRFSLYSEEILVFHPLQNPSLTNPQLNPIKKPVYWLDDFLSALHFYIVLKKWVEAGIVRLIVNPIQFDFELQKQFEEQAKIRAAKFQDSRDMSSLHNDATDSLAEHFSISCGDRSVDWIEKMLLKMQQPKFTNDDAKKFAQKIKNAYPNRNPLYNKLRIPKQSGLITEKLGANVEGINHLLGLTNSSVYTSDNMCWEMLKESSNNDFWTKANHSYSKTELSFLNNVDTAFVLNLRKEGRLSKLRNELKDVFSELSNINITEVTNSKIKELNEKLSDSINSSEADWELIKNEAENKRKYWLTASVGLPIIQHEVSFVPLLIGSVAWLANSIKGEKNKLNHFKNTNSLSVFVDLKHKDEGFFSDLKNCLF